MLPDSQTDRQTNKHARTLIAMVRTPTDDDVILITVILERRSVECIPPAPTLTFDLDLLKFNHRVRYDKVW